MSDPVPAEETGEVVTAEELGLEDGNYTVEVTLEGGSEKQTVESPAKLEIKDGKVQAELVWSSPNYDYMIVDGEKYTMTIQKEIPPLKFRLPDLTASWM